MRSSILDFLKVLSQPAHDIQSLGIVHLVLQFFQREVNDVVMMDFVRSDLVAEFEPYAVKDIDFLRREVRSVRPKVEDLILAVREIELNRQLWLGIR